MTLERRGRCVAGIRYARCHVSTLQQLTPPAPSGPAPSGFSFSRSGIEVSKIDGRWFLSGAKGLNFTA